MRWGILAVWLMASGICFAEDDPLTLDSLKVHDEDRPAQVTLREAVTFAAFIDGREAGTVLIPAQTAVDVVSIEDDGLRVVAGVNRATVAPEKTDLWERVQAIRTARAALPDPALADPVWTLKMPRSSLAAPWYTQRVAEQIDPWLAKYPHHSRAPEIEALRAAFVAEADRVTGGEVRRGQHWYTAAEAASRETEFAADDLQAEIEEAGRAHDGKLLATLLPEIPRYAREPSHPRLVHAALDAIAALLTTLHADDVKQELKQKREADVAAQEQVAKELRAALDHPVKGVASTSDKSYVKGADGLYRPHANYVFAHHYGNLAKYFPNDTDYYLPLANDVLADLTKQAKEADDRAADIVRIDRELASADETVTQRRRQWDEQRKALAQLPIASEEKALAGLQEASSLPLPQAMPRITEAAKNWPGSLVVEAASLARAEEALAAIDAAVAAGHIPEANRLTDLAQKMVDATPSAAPRREAVAQQLRMLTPWLATAKGFETAFLEKDFDQILQGHLQGDLPPSFQKWLAALKEKTTAQETASSEQLAAAKSTLKACKPGAAWTAFSQAKALWPDNPQIPPCMNALWVALSVSILVALLLCLGAWHIAATLRDKQRYRSKMKAKAGA